MSSMTIALLGNPNSGKTTLFNALTGSTQRVGNWPGVTVERKEGHFKWQNYTVDVIDLPGTYSLSMVSEKESIDERIACDTILNRKADLIINILDASHLERSFYLTLQLIEMKVPFILAINMMDMARNHHLRILLKEIEETLKCPVIALEANKRKGLNELKNEIIKNQVCHSREDGNPFEIDARLRGHATAVDLSYPPFLQEMIVTIAAEIPSQQQASWLAMRLLENDVFAEQFVSKTLLHKIPAYQKKINETLGEDPDILLADARYRFIERMMSRCVIKSSDTKKMLTQSIDNIVLNRMLGIPIFLVVMYLMFLFAINIGGAFQDFFDISSNTIFVEGLAKGLATFHTPNWLIALLTDGIGRGINTTLTFIPVIGAMFLFLAFLEDSGYMARAAFVVDRLMRALGLPGKSFVPMIVGFGCNVPSVMASRTLENKRDRILTVMMSPFMSCGARLAIYAVFTAAFFPSGGQDIVFVLYLIGIAMAMLTGFLLRKTVLQGDPAPLLMELPPYHLPQLTALFRHAWQRLKAFVWRAGKLIVPICLLLGVLGSLNTHGTLCHGEGDPNSILSVIGRDMTPIFAPMGIHQDNWPATVGLLTGVLAKEVVVGTLNALYSQFGHITELQAATFSFWGGLQDALASVPQNLSQLGSAFTNPILAEAPVNSLSQTVYGIIYHHFDGKIGAMAYLLFVLLYFPCISTTAAMLRELNRGWTFFSVLWTTGIAYGVAVLFYQTATLARHPISSIVWIVGLSVLFILVIVGMRLFAMHEDSMRGRYEFV